MKLIRSQPGMPWIDLLLQIVLAYLIVGATKSVLVLLTAIVVIAITANLRRPNWKMFGWAMLIALIAQRIL